MDNIIILNGGTILGHGAAPQQATTGVAAEPGAEQEEGGFFGGATGLILIYVVLFGVIWLMFIRPQKKRQKQQKEMIEALKVGDNIVTSSGMFGKIVDMGQDAYIVEFGTPKGVRIAVSKESIGGVREPILTPNPKV